MARHSFIRMSKLPNVKGRISYITSHAKQEYLYATYRTADNTFWKNLARESQQEFQRSGTTGKCIEARELIIALPEIYTTFDPQQVLEEFSNKFRQQYGVECVSALLCTTTNARRITPSTSDSAKGNCFPHLTSRLPPEAYFTTKQEKGYEPRKKSQTKTGKSEKAVPLSKRGKFTKATYSQPKTSVIKVKRS